MKYCQICGAAYDDPNMRFCLSDGSELRPMEPLDDMPTVVDPNAFKGLNAQPTIQMNPAAPTFQTRSGMPFAVKVVIGLVIVGVIGLGLAIIGGAIFFASMTSELPSRDQPAEKPASPSRPAENKVETDIEKRMQDIQKEMEKVRDDAISKMPDIEGLKNMQDARVAKVNSPKDGYLALRSQPGTEQGERLAKIPNGETIVVYGCTAETKVDGKTGKWCRAIYESKFGWVFDAWIKQL